MSIVELDVDVPEIESNCFYKNLTHYMYMASTVLCDCDPVHFARHALFLYSYVPFPYYYYYYYYYYDPYNYNYNYNSNI